MGKPLGPRTVVKFGRVAVYRDKKKSTKDAYIAPRKAVADYFGMDGQAIITKKGAGGRTYSVRGQRGGGSIKLPTNKKGKNGSVLFMRCPVPAGATIAQIQVFLKAVIKKNKPKMFYSPDGQGWPTGF
jgi:hypothetical protein